MPSSDSRRSFIKKAAVLAAGTSSAGYIVRAVSQEGPIRIGFPTSLSGPYAAETLDQVRCADIAVQEFNESGGLRGRRAEIVSRDDKLNPGEGAAKALELIEKEKVHFVVGTLSAAVQLAINNITRERRMIFVPVSQSDTINEAKGWSKYTFHEALNPHMTAGAVGRYAYKNFGTRVAFLTADYAYGHEMVRGFKRAGQPFKINVVAEINHPLGVSDFSSFLPTLQAAKPDVLFLSNYGRDQLNAIKQATEFGLKRSTKLVTPIVSLVARQAGGSAMWEDVYGGAAYYWSLEDRFPSAKAFNARFRKAYGGVPDYGSHSYAAVKSLLDCVRSTGTTDPERIVEAMRSLKYDYCKGPQYYRACDHQSVQSVIVLKSRKTASEKDDKLFDIVAVDNPGEDGMRSCKELGHAA